MLYRMTATEMEDTWSRVRKVYLEAARQLEVMVVQRAPFRERVWRSWNRVMRKAERQQRPGFRFFFVGRMVGTRDTIPARVVPELGLYYRIYGYLRIFE